MPSFLDDSITPRGALTNFDNDTGRTFRERETFKKSKKQTKSDHYDNLINEERELLNVASNLMKDQNQSKDSNNQSQDTHADDLFC